MSEQPFQGALVNSQMIASLAARTALETPGVLRLEPTIQGFLAQLGPAALRSLLKPKSQNGSYRHDGVTATIVDGTVQVHLDIATDIAYTALSVAQSVQNRVRETLQHTGLTPGHIHINILAIEPCTDTAKS
ncbi:hypothetical protein [Arthrobacter sp. H35-D1]|uniref:Asp23/Gls24 family envelope stress response protein n=1 Tax=Arthrobacter sp. H35-D1 TaxID=3046202 RepID=UPI0024B98DDA|nr:hypothetical protein [Arthrobacter sp. H35-D1]MDJ0315250.1 hypothetical protein [Arthrobacter sp. H35-D1]